MPTFDILKLQNISLDVVSRTSERKVLLCPNSWLQQTTAHECSGTGEGPSLAVPAPPPQQPLRQRVFPAALQRRFQHSQLGPPGGPSPGLPIVGQRAAAISLPTAVESICPGRCTEGPSAPRHGTVSRLRPALCVRDGGTDHRLGHPEHHGKDQGDSDGPQHRPKGTIKDLRLSA